MIPVLVAMVHTMCPLCPFVSSVKDRGFSLGHIYIEILYVHIQKGFIFICSLILELANNVPRPIRIS